MSFHNCAEKARLYAEQDNYDYLWSHITNDVLDLHLDGDVGIKKVVVVLSIDTNIL
jgi:hypothetical protein